MTPNGANDAHFEATDIPKSANTGAPPTDKVTSHQSSVHKVVSVSVCVGACLPNKDTSHQSSVLLVCIGVCRCVLVCVGVLPTCVCSPDKAMDMTAMLVALSTFFSTGEPGVGSGITADILRAVVRNRLVRTTRCCRLLLLLRHDAQLHDDIIPLMLHIWLDDDTISMRCDELCTLTRPPVKR